MQKRAWKSLKKFFKTPRLAQPQPALYNSGYEAVNENTRHQVEIRNIELANLKLQKEALEKNLIVMHRTMLVTLFAVLISMLLGVYAVKASQKVNLYPQVKVFLDDKESARQTN